MKLKKIIPLLFISTSFVAVQSAFAAEIASKVDLAKVIVSLKGAELQGTSSVSVPKGESEILLSGLANNINVNSINVGIGNEAMILSTTLVDNYLIKKDESDNLLSLRSALKNLESEKDILNIKLSVVNEEITLLQGNRIDLVTNKSNNALNEAKQAINFVKDNLVNALTEQRSIQIQLTEIDKKINQYQQQIGIKENQNRSQKVIKVKLYSPKAVTLPVSVSYLTPDAGWAPTYDVRVSNIGSPLVLTYKANIYQNSGLNWDNIDFTLSTANPSEGITAPQPMPWNIYLNEGKSSYYGSLSKSVSESRMIAEPMADMAYNQFADYVVTNNNGITTQFDIKLPYSIQGNSRDNILTLKAKEVAVDYRYIATPKLDDNTFLQAQITDWEKLALLPGKSTVFYAGNYIGESYITTQGVKDKLNISLGRDKDILINRNQDLNETSKPSFFGNEVSQKFAYTIDVKNTKDLPIDITIYDQLPTIQNKIIKLEDSKYTGAQYDKDTGLLTWQINLKAKEAKQLPFSFKINYPKDKADYIIGL